MAGRIHAARPHQPSKETADVAAAPSLGQLASRPFGEAGKKRQERDPWAALERQARLAHHLGRLIKEPSVPAAPGTKARAPLSGRPEAPIQRMVDPEEDDRGWLAKRLPYLLGGRAPHDQRNYWQRNVPEILGGRSVPTGAAGDAGVGQQHQDEQGAAAVGEGPSGGERHQEGEEARGEPAVEEEEGRVEGQREGEEARGEPALEDEPAGAGAPPQPIAQITPPNAQELAAMRARADKAFRRKGKQGSPSTAAPADSPVTLTREEEQEVRKRGREKSDELSGHGRAPHGSYASSSSPATQQRDQEKSRKAAEEKAVQQALERKRRGEDP